MKKKILSSLLMLSPIATAATISTSCSNTTTTFATSFSFGEDMVTEYTNLYNNQTIDPISLLNFNGTKDGKKAVVFEPKVYTTIPSNPDSDALIGLPNGLRIENNGFICGTIGADFLNGEISKKYQFGITAHSAIPDKDSDNQKTITMIVKNQKLVNINVNVEKTINMTSANEKIIYVSFNTFPSISDFDESKLTWNVSSDLPNSYFSGLDNFKNNINLFFNLTPTAEIIGHHHIDISPIYNGLNIQPTIIEVNITA